MAVRDRVIASGADRGDRLRAHKAGPAPEACGGGVGEPGGSPTKPKKEARGGNMVSPTGASRRRATPGQIAVMGCESLTAFPKPSRALTRTCGSSAAARAAAAPRGHPTRRRRDRRARRRRADARREWAECEEACGKEGRSARDRTACRLPHRSRAFL